MKFSTYARRRAQGFGPAAAFRSAEKSSDVDAVVPVSLGVILVCAIYLVAEVIDLFIL